MREVVQGDATTYRHPAALHVVISETMQRTLAEEPFVAILRNLRPQLAPGGILVPERVSIALASIDAQDEQARWRGAAVPFDAPTPGRRSKSTLSGSGRPRGSAPRCGSIGAATTPPAGSP